MVTFYGTGKQHNKETKRTPIFKKIVMMLTKANSHKVNPYLLCNFYGQSHATLVLIAYMNNQCSGEMVHLRSPIRAFTVRVHKVHV